MVKVKKNILFLILGDMVGVGECKIFFIEVVKFYIYLLLNILIEVVNGV